MVVANSPNDIEDVVLPTDDPEDPTIFEMRFLKHQEQRNLDRFIEAATAYSDAITGAMAKKKSFEELMVSTDFIEATIGKPGKPIALVGWRNFKNADGEEIEFNKSTYLDYLPGDVKLFLAMHVFSRNRLGVASKKSSSSEPSSA